MERILCRELLAQIDGSVDPLQFAYIPKRSTVDASLTLLHKVKHHLKPMLMLELFLWILHERLIPCIHTF